MRNPYFLGELLPRLGPEGFPGFLLGKFGTLGVTFGVNGCVFGVGLFFAMFLFFR